MAADEKCVGVRLTFPASSFGDSSFESSLESSDSALLDVTLIAVGSDNGAACRVELKCSKYVWARHSSTLRARFEKEPTLTEVHLPSLSGPALASLYRLITMRKLYLGWPGLEDFCAAIHQLRMPSVDGILRQATKELLVAAGRQAPALQRDLMQLGHQYTLPQLVELGISESLRTVPRSAQTDHFSGLPHPVRISIVLRKELEVEDRQDAVETKVQQLEGRLNSLAAEKDSLAAENKELKKGVSGCNEWLGMLTFGVIIWGIFVAIMLLAKA